MTASGYNLPGSGWSPLRELFGLEGGGFGMAGAVGGARAAIVATVSTQGSASTNGPHTAGSHLPATGQRHFAAVTVSGDPGAAPTIGTQNGLTYVPIATLAFPSTPARRVTLYEGTGTPATGSPQISYAIAVSAASWAFWDVSGVADVREENLDTTLLTSGTTINATLPLALENAQNAMLVAAGRTVNAAITADADFVTIAAQNGSGGGGNGFWVGIAIGQTTCDPTFTTAAAGIIAVELVAA